jgi:hypothetical protein
MGRIAAQYCERIILTNEDPYDENPQKIVEEMARGIDDESKLSIIMDRRTAIRTALEKCPRRKCLCLFLEKVRIHTSWAPNNTKGALERCKGCTTGKWRHFLVIRYNVWQKDVLVFFLAFFGILLVLGFATQGGGLFEGAGSATSTTTGVGTSNTVYVPIRKYSWYKHYTRDAHQRHPLPHERLKKRLHESIVNSRSSRKKLRIAKLQEPVSPYAGSVDLRASNARDTNPDTEYLSLRANSSNTTTITISNWYLKKLRHR